MDTQMLHEVHRCRKPTTPGKYDATRPETAGLVPARLSHFESANFLAFYKVQSPTFSCRESGRFSTMSSWTVAALFLSIFQVFMCKQRVKTTCLKDLQSLTYHK